MKITVAAGEKKDNQLACKMTVSAKDVDAIVAKTYKDIAHKYNFQGFRKGHAPRPVIDTMLGHDAVMGQATNDLINQAEPLMLNELDIVPMGEVSYGEDPKLVEGGKKYSIDATIPVRPVAELDSYDAPSITMPPEEATDAEVEQQIEVLQGYHTNYEALKTDRAVKKTDFVDVDIENVKGAEAFSGKGRLLAMGESGFPEAFDKAIVGMKPKETKDVSFKEGKTEISCKVTVNAIKKKVTPKLDDEFVKKAFGFKSVDELRDAVKSEIEADKKRSLPGLKEDRVIDAMASRLKLDEVPEAYTEQVYNDIARNFLNQLQSQGMTLDAFLQARQISIQEFMADLQAQAQQRARESLALDAIVAKQNIEATADDVKQEFKNAGTKAKEINNAIKAFEADGRMPAVRESIRRAKAVDWLLENAKVEIVDEIAQKRSGKKATSKKATAKKSTAKKTTTKKSTSKKASDKKESK